MSFCFPQTKTVMRVWNDRGWETVHGQYTHKHNHGKAGLKVLKQYKHTLTAQEILKLADGQESCTGEEGRPSFCSFSLEDPQHRSVRDYSVSNVKYLECAFVRVTSHTIQFQLPVGKNVSFNVLKPGEFIVPRWLSIHLFLFLCSRMTLTVQEFRRIMCLYVVCSCVVSTRP